MTQQPWSKEEFEQKLRAKGNVYHIYHPFHIAMNKGECTKEQIQGWVANRFFYQSAIPVKDAGIMANCWDMETRRKWIQRILDHDGEMGDERLGGIEAWLRLGEAVGLTRDDILSERLLLPGVKFAVCSSLTEMFAPEIHQSRLDTWPTHYDWIDPEGFSYFQMRLNQARRDVQHGLQITLEHFETRRQQERALNILQFKLDVLWSMADAISLAYEFDRKPYSGVADQSVCHKGFM